MRRLILQTSISVDGYVAALDKSHPWSEGSEEDEAFKRWILDSVWAAGAHLMGRVTYEEMAAFWPTSMPASRNTIRRRARSRPTPPSAPNASRSAERSTPRT